MGVLKSESLLLQKHVGARALLEVREVVGVRDVNQSMQNIGVIVPT